MDDEDDDEEEGACRQTGVAAVVADCSSMLCLIAIASVRVPGAVGCMVGSKPTTMSTVSPPPTALVTIDKMMVWPVACPAAY